MSSPRKPSSGRLRWGRSQPRRPGATGGHPWSGLARLRPLHLGQRLLRRPSEAFALLWLLIFAGILLLALVPGQSRVETQVVTQQLRFVTDLSADQTRHRFLDSIRDLRSLSLRGKHLTPLVLNGQFSHPTLGSFTELKVELPDDQSWFSVEPMLAAEDSSPRQMEVLALHLQDQVTVAPLTYVPANRRLGLTFTHAVPPDPVEGSLLEVYLGQQPLRLTLEGYRVVIGNQTLADPDGTQPLTLTFQPDIAELVLPLPPTGELSLSLPPLADIDTLRWFWDLPVTQVGFTSEIRRGGDALLRSSIRSGKVRMDERELDIESEQFLLLQNPGLQHLRYLQLLEAEGIEVRARGETSLVQVGIDPDFPLREVRSNIIAQTLRPDMVVPLVSFSGAMVASLLSWFINNLFKSSGKNG